MSSDPIVETEALEEPIQTEEPVQEVAEEPIRRRSQWNIYTVMLLIAVLFLCAASLLLWTEFSRYSFQWRPVGS